VRIFDELDLTLDLLIKKRVFEYFYKEICVDARTTSL